MTAEERYAVYGKLKTIRERACQLQSMGLEEIHRFALGEVVGTADRLGVWYCPEQWSRFDDPPLPGESS